jgi:hypothetical protein
MKRDRIKLNSLFVVTQYRVGKEGGHRRRGEGREEETGVTKILKKYHTISFFINISQVV